MDAHTADSLLSSSEHAVPSLRGEHGNAVLQELAQRYDEILAALAWLLDQGAVDEARRLAYALVPFWMMTARLDEGRTWLERVLQAPGGDDALRSKALYAHGYLIFWTGDDERSAALFQSAVELARRIDEPGVVALGLAGLARVALRTDVEEARRLCREALAVTEGTDDQVGRSNAMHVLGVASQMAGDFDEARAVMSERIRLAREHGDLATISGESANLGMVERQLGHLDEAEALAREAMDIAQRRGDTLMTVWMMNGLAAVAADRGDLERAATLIGAADAGMESVGGAWPPDELVQYERTVQRLTEAMGEAGFAQAGARGRSLSVPEAIRFALGPR